MAPPTDDSASLQQARARARRRLIGAVVLLAVGVIVFPILFETRPRPLPPDIPITVARKDSGTVVTAPAPAPRLPAPQVPPPDAGNEGGGAAAEPPASAAAPPPAAAASARPMPVAEPARAAASRPVAVAVADARPAATPASQARPESKPDPKPEPRPPAKAEAKADTKTDTKTDAKADVKADVKSDAKADAKPRGEPPKAAADGAASAPKAGRYVVQVGAYTDALAVRDARQKVEKLGLKTYTQEVDTPTGRRTRVRVGPFDTKAEADAASAKLKGAGLPVYLLLL